MIIKEFLQWTISADTSLRIRAARSLCEAYISGQFLDDEIYAAEGAMALLLEDGSSQVRTAMAEVLAHSNCAPVMVIDALSQDQLTVSAPILAYSTMLSDNTLVDLIATGDFSCQFIIARREFLSPSVCAALIEVGNQDAVLGLLDNKNAQITQLSIIRLAGRFAHYAPIRSKLLERPDLPVNIRQKLVEELSNTFADDAFFKALIGNVRARHVTKDACFHATIALAETLSSDDMIALVEHLRMNGQITPSFLMHILSIGNVDFFAIAISQLAGKPASQIQAILNDGQYCVVKALYASAGLDIELCPVFVNATLLWRNASKKNIHIAVNEIIEMLLKQYEDEMLKDSPIAELLMMLENIKFDQNRRAAKQYALTLTKNAA